MSRTMAMRLNKQRNALNSALLENILIKRHLSVPFTCSQLIKQGMTVSATSCKK